MLKMFPELSDEERLRRAKEMLRYLCLHPPDLDGKDSSERFLEDLSERYQNDLLSSISEKQYKWLKDIFEMA